MGPPRSTGTWTVPAVASTTAFCDVEPRSRHPVVVARDVDLGARLGDGARRGRRRGSG